MSQAIDDRAQVNRNMRARAAQGDSASRIREGQVVIEPKTKTKVKRPSMYKVILINDDYPRMECVVDILKSVFHKGHAEATRTMLRVHNTSSGVAGIYPYEIA